MFESGIGLSRESPQNLAILATVADQNRAVSGHRELDTGDVDETLYRPVTWLDLILPRRGA